MDLSPVNIFEYADFREFLRDYQITRQTQEKTFTKSHICKLLGLPNTRSFFQDILNKKPLSKNYVERFVAVLGFDEEEAQYFRTLVSFNQASYEKERELLFDQLISLNRTPKKLVEPTVYEFYKKWYHNAILNLLDIEDVKDDYNKLSRVIYPSVTGKQVKESIQLLRQLKLIKRNVMGYWKPSHKVLDSGPYVKDELIKQYQLQCSEMVNQYLLKPTEDPYNISTISMSINQSTYKRIEKRIQKLKSEIYSMVHKDREQPDQAYHLNIHFIPQSKKKEIVDE